MTAAKKVQPPDEMTVSFDGLVKEASRPPVRLPLPDGDDDLMVNFPTGDVVKAIDAAMMQGDEDAAFTALLGDDGGKRVNALLGGAPADVGANLLRAIFGKWDIELGNSLGSSM